MVAEKVHADAELDEKEMGKVAQMGGKAKAMEKENGSLYNMVGAGSRRRRARKSKGKSLRRKKMTMKQRQQQQRQQRQQRRRR
jgi:hypothetical protein